MRGKKNLAQFIDSGKWMPQILMWMVIILWESYGNVLGAHGTKSWLMIAGPFLWLLTMLSIRLLLQLQLVHFSPSRELNAKTWRILRVWSYLPNLPSVSIRFRDRILQNFTSKQLWCECPWFHPKVWRWISTYLSQQIESGIYEYMTFTGKCVRYTLSKVSLVCAWNWLCFPYATGVKIISWWGFLYFTTQLLLLAFV